jgi:hypothetical protein
MSAAIGPACALIMAYQLNGDPLHDMPLLQAALCFIMDQRNAKEDRLHLVHHFLEDKIRTAYKI